LNRALFSITTALAKKKVGGPQANAKRGAVLDNVMASETKFTSLLLLEAMINNIDITKCNVDLLGVLAEDLYKKYDASRQAQK
jgi:hypothetical protein